MQTHDTIVDSNAVDPANENTKCPVFADDPFRGQPLFVSSEHLHDLNGPFFLKTGLIDYILRHVMPKDLPEDVLLGCSNSQLYFDAYNKNTYRRNKRTTTTASSFNADVLRQKFQVYSQRRYRFIVANCDSGHFYVASIVFDMEETENPIQDVCVLDSYYRSRRRKTTPEGPTKTSRAGRFLLSFQNFLAQYVAFSTKHSGLLLGNPELILHRATYASCPQQENTYDCGLFAVATLLHLVDGHTVSEESFGQADITKLRQHLYDSLSNGVRINWDTMRSFFPVLNVRQANNLHLLDTTVPSLSDSVSAGASSEEDEIEIVQPSVVEEPVPSPASPTVEETLEETEQPEVSHPLLPSPSTSKALHDDSTDDEMDRKLPPADEDLIGFLDNTQKEAVDDDEAMDDQNEEPINEDDDSYDDNEYMAMSMSTTQVTQEPQPAQTGEYNDKQFITFFCGRKYNTVKDIDQDMDEYEAISGYRFIIQKSTAISRQYRCRSHVGCTFVAPFGRKRGTDFIILKVTLTHPIHFGPEAPKPKGGRGHKQRCKGRLEPILDHVACIKDSFPVAKDVMKAAANMHAREVTYSQAYRTVTDAAYQKWEYDKDSFEMIIPYLDKFDKLNDDSTVVYETDIDSRIFRVFICPGFMERTMMHVRPVMSLDACHLRSKWKGTLYMASVKTSCEEIYPVAFAIMKDNENEAGWTWFLEQLQRSIKCLVQPHPVPTVRYKYFSFVSDRSKGLLNALNKVFPDNYHWFCVIHLARNAEKWGGQRITSDVIQLGKTFSHRYANFLLKRIEKVSKKAAEYVKEIEVERWRGTAWQQDDGLPPRYGIVSTNMSESANNMFEKARDGSWLYTIDTILCTMMERIYTLRKKMEGRQGFVAYLVRELRQRWDDCAGYRVLEGTGNEDEEVTIVRLSKTAGESPKNFALNVCKSRCECGHWQDTGYPCIDAMAFFRLHKKYSVTYVISEYIDPLYRYETEYEMMKENIHPVCMETIAPDGCTLPPDSLEKRTSGRPKKKRYRKRARTACDPKESSIVCSRCGQNGHNVRTCATREENEGNDLDLS